jgi:hypothetical protein
VAQSGANLGDQQGGSSAAASAAAFLDEAREKLKQGDTPGALICLRTIAGLAGCPPDLVVEACKLLAQAGDNEGALACYLSAGTSYLRDQKDVGKARHALQAGHALDVHNLDVIFMLGQADVADGRMQEGLAKFIDVLRKSNLKHVPALFEAGCIYQSNGQYDQAMLAFKKVLDRDKNHVQASVRIGQLYQSKENMNDAVGYYIQAAQIARECQHWGTARQIASMVLAIDPQNQKARVLLADLEEQGLGADETPSAEAATAPANQAASAERPPPLTARIAPPAASRMPGPPAALARSAESAAKTSSTQPGDPQISIAASSQTAAPATSEPAPARPTPQLPTPTPAASAQAPPPTVLQQPAALLAAQVAARTNIPASTPPTAQSAVRSDATGAPPVVAASPASAAAHEPSASGDDIERARQMLNAIEAQRQAAQQDLQSLLTTREELQKALADQRSILETATMRKKDLDEQLSVAQNAADEAATTRAAARAASGASAAAEKDAIATLAAERASMEASIAELAGQMQELGAQRAAQETAVKQLGAQREELTGEVDALTGKMQDAKKLTDELEAIRAATPVPDEEEVAKAQALIAQVGALERKRAEHEAELGAAQASLAHLTSRIDAARREADQAEAAQAARAAEAEALSQRVAALLATIKDLEHRGSGNSGAIATPAAQPNVGPQGAHARAAAHLAAGEVPQAIEAYCQALRTNPQDADAAYQAGTLTAEHGKDLERAERLLTQAAELRPEHAATRYQLAVVKARRGNVVEGAEMLAALARSDANNADFVDQFVEHLEKDAEDGDLGAKYRLGVAYRELGRIEEALVTLQSIQHEPEFGVPCLIAIGLCLRRQGLDGAAAKRFAKAIETPGYPDALYYEALYNLGDLYEAKGTQESLALALSSFEELYARDCTYRDVGERVRVVKTNLGSAERQKVKRLPTRLADSQGNP